MTIIDVQAPDAPDGPASELATMVEPAGFWIRAGARLVDWIVQAAAGMVVGVLGVLIAAIVSAATGRPPDDMIAGMQQSTFIGCIGSVLAGIAYHSVFEGIAGNTVGKRVFGLQVVSMSIGRITFAQAMKRSGAFLVDALFFGAIGAQAMHGSREKQRIGDQWAETRVIHRRSLPVQFHTPTSRMFLGFIAAFAVACVLAGVTLTLESLWYLRGQ